MTDQAAEADITMIRAQAKTLADIGDFEKARDAMSRAIDIAPNDPELHAYMAYYTYRCRTIEMNERERLAKHHLAVSMDQGPNNPHALYIQGQILVYQGNGVRAKAFFEASLNAKPDYAPAVQALERLGARNTATVTLTAMPAQIGGPHGVRPRKARTSLIVLTVLAAIGGGAGLLMNTSEDRDMAAFAKKLGTKFTLQSVSTGDQQLVIDVGASWERFAGPDRTNEIKVLGAGAKQQGFRLVMIFSGSNMVATVQDGKICASATCLGLESAAPLGAAPAPSAVPPSPPPSQPARGAAKPVTNSAPPTPARQPPSAPQPSASAPGARPPIGSNAAQKK